MNNNNNNLLPNADYLYTLKFLKQYKCIKRPKSVMLEFDISNYLLKLGITLFKCIFTTLVFKKFPITNPCY